MTNAAVRPRASMMALAGVSVASAAVIGAVPSMSQAATYATASPAATALNTATTTAAATLAGAAPAAATNPLAIYQTVLAKAQTAIDKLQKTAPKDEYPILTQLLANQSALVDGVVDGAVAGEWTHGAAPDFSSLQTQIQAVLDGFDVAGTVIKDNVTKALGEQLPKLLDAVSTSLATGDIEGAMNNLMMAVITPVYALIKPGVNGGATASLLQILNIPLNAGLLAAGVIPNADIAGAVSQPLKNASKVLDVVLKDDFNYIGMGLISPVAGGLGGFGRGVQNVVNALGDNDLDAALNALIQAPAITLDGFLHGGYGPSVAGLVGFGDSLRVVSGGLLGGPMQLFGKDADGNRAAILPGTGWVLQRIQQNILKAITPVPPKTVSADMGALVKAQTADNTVLPTVTVADAPGTPGNAADESAATSRSADATSDHTDSTSQSSSADKSNSPASTATAPTTSTSESGTNSAIGGDVKSPAVESPSGGSSSDASPSTSNDTSSSSTPPSSTSSSSTSNDTSVSGTQSSSTSVGTASSSTSGSATRS